MDKYTQFLEDAKKSGEIPDEWIKRIEDTYEASGLRNDVRTERERAQKLETDLRSLRIGLLTDKFKEMGIPGKPTAYSLPDDMDPTNIESIQSWAVEQGLITPPQTTEPASREVHDRISQASNEGGNSSIPSSEELDPRKMSETEFYEHARKIEAQRIKT
jgi:hypothetical protein